MQAVQVQVLSAVQQVVAPWWNADTLRSGRSAFGHLGSTPSGATMFGMATEAQRTSWRAYYERFREKCFDILGRKCAICGSTENLEIDHRDWKTKVINISQAQAPRRWEEVKRELKKCQVLCEDCHRLKSNCDLAEQRLCPEVHGTVSCYRHHGCRCEECVTANAEYKRTWRIEHGETSGLRKNAKAVCGTASAYSNGCRCDDCRMAHTEKMREYRGATRRIGKSA